MSNLSEVSFRDHINTTNEEGRRSWVYAKKPGGRLHNYRSIVAGVLLAIFFILPFVRSNGHPFFMLNIFERKFILFGKIFWPQDFHLFVIGLITLIVGIVLFTVVYGRVWCGWVCPQTIFLEMVYRKIEFLIEGSPHQQRKMDNGPLTFELIWKKGLKHLIFISIAILVIHTLASYVVGAERMFQLFKAGPGVNIGAFFALSALSGAFYFVFARFREQVCTLVCPYGRLQGVMLDANSLVVSYDFRRGEDRGRIIKGENRAAQGKGDCIDCENCVAVCPTGIDIRNGTQLECINCTACIDICNSVMQKVGYKPGLIRIASSNEIAEGRKFKVTGRIIAYTLLLLTLIVSTSALLILRKDTETTILRVPGSLHQDMGHAYTNIYNVKILNKSSIDISVQIRPVSIDGQVQQIGDEMIVPAQESAEGVFLLYLDKSMVTASKIPVTFGIYSEGELIEKERATFVGP